MTPYWNKDTINQLLSANLFGQGHEVLQKPNKIKIQDDFFQEFSALNPVADRSSNMIKIQLNIQWKIQAAILSPPKRA